MKRFQRVVFALMAACTVFMFAACDDGGGGDSGSSLPMDDRLVGQWEGNIEGDPAIITITGNNKMTMITVYADDYVAPPETDGDPGQINGGSKYTLSATAMIEDDPLTLDIDESLGGTMNWTPTHEWVEYGEELPDSTETAPVDNWYPYSSEDGIFGYELSVDDTELTCSTPGGVMTFYKGTAPAPDPKLVGTWSANIEKDDMRMDVILGSNGSFSMEQYDVSGTPTLAATESGTWGVYRSVEGKKYFVITTTRSRELPASAATVFRFSRMQQWLNMFSTPDTFFIYADGEMVFERQGSDPAEPAPDANFVGYWLGQESIDDDEDGGAVTEDITVDSLNIMYDDNTFLKLQWDFGFGDMYGGMRGHYLANNGEMIVNIEEFWTWDDVLQIGSWSSMIENVDLPYSIDAGVMTMTGEFQDSTEGLTDFILEKIESSLPATLAGTWTGTVGPATVTSTFNSDGTYYFILDTGSIETESGSMVFITFDAQTYMLKTKTAYDNEDPMSAPTSTYEVELVPCVLPTSGNPDQMTVTIDATDITFTRVPE